jgi:hypothetical protein
LSLCGWVGYHVNYLYWYRTIEMSNVGLKI